MCFIHDYFLSCLYRKPRDIELKHRLLELEKKILDAEKKIEKYFKAIKNIKSTCCD